MTKTKISAALLSLVAVLSLGVLTGCENDGPAEEFGEKIDEAANDAKREIEDAAD